MKKLLGHLGTNIFVTLVAFAAGVVSMAILAGLAGMAALVLILSALTSQL